VARRYRTIIIVGFVLVNAAACAAVVGLDYEICEGGGGEGTSCDAPDATTNVTSDAPPARPDGGGGGDDDGATTDAMIPDLPDANPCKPCPRGTVHQLCVDAGCADSRRVFLSSTQSTAALGGPNGADTRCQMLATDAGLNGAWRAWISGNGSAPDDRFVKSNVAAYRLLDGTIVALNWNDLTDGTLAHAIDLDERGNRVSGVEVWTGTRSNGESGGQKCAGFTAMAGETTRVGVSSIFTDAGWTEVYLQFCDRTDPRVYCFEQ
jgi:hypothetical protein